MKSENFGEKYREKFGTFDYLYGQVKRSVPKNIGEKRREKFGTF